MRRSDGTPPTAYAQGRGAEPPTGGDSTGRAAAWAGAFAAVAAAAAVAGDQADEGLVGPPVAGASLASWQAEPGWLALAATPTLGGLAGPVVPGHVEPKCLALLVGSAAVLRAAWVGGDADASAHGGVHVAGGEQWRCAASSWCPTPFAIAVDMRVRQACSKRRGAPPRLTSRARARTARSLRRLARPGPKPPRRSTAMPVTWTPPTLG